MFCESIEIAFNMLKTFLLLIGCLLVIGLIAIAVSKFAKKVVNHIKNNMKIKLKTNKRILKYFEYISSEDYISKGHLFSLKLVYLLLFTLCFVGMGMSVCDIVFFYQGKTAAIIYAVVFILLLVLINVLSVYKISKKY